jgi:hypothetical protein
MAISLVTATRYRKMYGKSHFLPDISRAAAQRLAMT